MRGVSEQRNQHADDEHAGSPQPEGARGDRTVRSMLFAMLPIALIVLGIAGLTGRCSFSPLGPSVEPGSAPTVDAAAELRRAAQQVEFPVLEPRLPEGWRANSAGVRQVAPDTQAVRVGWLTDAKHYLRLSQSTASEAALAAFETKQSPRAKGVVQAAGQRWVVYESIRSEVAWVGERGGVRLLITGSGTEAEFRTLARAVMSAPVVTPH